MHASVLLEHDDRRALDRYIGSMRNDELVPSDFPRELSGAMPGSSQRYLAKKVDDRCVVGVSDAELYARVERGLLASTELGTTLAENRWILRELYVPQGWNEASS